MIDDGSAACRKTRLKEQPLRGARIVACLHVTAQTAVFVETLVALGASVRLCGCNIFSTQDDAAAALALAGVSVFAWKGQTEEEFWWCLNQAATADAWLPNLIIDDGADMTMLMSRDYPEVFRNLKGATTAPWVADRLCYHVASSVCVPAARRRRRHRGSGDGCKSPDANGQARRTTHTGHQCERFRYEIQGAVRI